MKMKFYNFSNYSFFFHFVNMKKVKVGRDRSQKVANNLEVGRDRSQEVANNLEVGRDRSQEVANNLEVGRDRSQESQNNLEVGRDRSQEVASWSRPTLRPLLTWGPATNRGQCVCSPTHVLPKAIENTLQKGAEAEARTHSTELQGRSAGVSGWQMPENDVGKAVNLGAAPFQRATGPKSPHEGRGSQKGCLAYAKTVLWCILQL